MLTAQLTELLRRLRAGSLDRADTEIMEQASAQELLAELGSDYGFRFQERRLREKWEVGMARSVRHEFAIHTGRDSFFPIPILILDFRNCLFLSGEGDSVTGIAAATRLRLQPIRKPHKGLALTTGRGFKLDKAPDGWSIKPLEKRTVKLSEEFLQKRGWRFDSLWQFASKR